MAMSIDLISQEIGSGHTVGSEEDRMEQETNLTDFVPPIPHDSPLSGGHTLEVMRVNLTYFELMNICTKLSNRVLALEEAKTTQDKVITRLKLRVRRLEKKTKARTSQPMKRRLFKGRVETSTDKSLEVIVEDKGSGEKGGSTADQVSAARLEVSVATPSTPPTTTTIFGDEDLTIAQTLIKMRSEKAKEKGVAFRDVKEPPRLTRSTITLQPLPTIGPKDKDLAQIIYEEELAELDRAQKERQKQEEATIAAMTEEFNEIQARIDADYELVIEDFVPINSENKEKKSVEPEGKDKKGKRIKRVADSASKQKSSKKQKMMQEQESAKSDEEESTDYEQENKELRMWLTVVSDEEETVDLEILSTKYPIVDWESQILGNVDIEDKHVYKIIRANGNTSYHKSLSKKRYPLIKEMLKKMLNWKLEAEAESKEVRVYTFNLVYVASIKWVVELPFNARLLFSTRGVPKPGYCWNDDEDCECCDDGVDGFEPVSCWYDGLGLNIRPTKDFKAKDNKVKAKLALLSSSASTFKALMVKSKSLISEVYEWDEEKVSSDDNEMVEVKVLMALAEDNDVVSKEGARNGKWGHSAKDCWSKTSVPSYQSPFQSKSLSSPQHKPELRPTKDIEAKYNKVKAKLALLSSSASASKASLKIMMLSAKKVPEMVNR
nr:hypothetical protein [Tanacetum cinerariifolium]